MMARTVSFNKKTGRIFYRSFMALCLTAATQAAFAEKAYDFDESFVKNLPGVKVDVARYATGNPIDPGIYTLDIFLNGRQISRENVQVVREGAGTKACLSYDLVKSLSIKDTVFSSQQAEELRTGNQCIALEDVVKESHAAINSADMQMDISIPQIYLLRSARGYVAPEFWDKGETAFTLNYDTNYYRSVNDGREYDSFYGRSLAGFNLGGWMFRHEGSLSWRRQQGDESHHYNAINTYVQRDIPQLKSRLLLGEGNTSGELFDTLSFRGAQISTVDQMWPDSQRGYAPEIRGVARTSAQVTVSQNGSKIYETTVSPGPFNITDLYPTGYGGDLDVTVKEADGSETRFSVPYAAMTRLKRPGMTFYSVTGGVSRKDNMAYTPSVYQGTIQHGFTNSLTGYTGILGSDNYISALLGGAFGLPIGAISLDITGAQTKYGDEKKQGVSYRATYSKKVAQTDTNFTLAAYRFSSSGYYSYDNALQINNYYKKNKSNGINYLSRPKQRFSMTASQNFGESYGNVYLTGFIQNYWNSTGTNTQFQLGYNNRIGRVSYTLSANRLLYSTGGHDTQLSLDFSIPLGSESKNYVTGSATHNKDGVTAQTAVNGVLGENDQYSYNVGASRDIDNKKSGSVSGQYRSPYSMLTASYTRGENYYSASGGASGAVVALPDGINFSAYQSTTYAVVTAADAEGARVLGYPNIVLNGSGRAVVPNLNPYRINELAIDPKGIPLDVELESTQQRVIPVEGAVVRLDYKTSKGKPLLIRANQPDGNALPFGASVNDENGNLVTTVSQGGQIYVRLNKDISRLHVSWGKTANDNCLVNLESGAVQSSDNQTLARLTTTCSNDQIQPVRYASNTENKDNQG
ncbi:fimbria/pilus outer membrane usher protein [Pantoea agglomerans]|uniref:fimbria/pilus outer membrane usher protein n=1 Tax=Enterobacter agglomerans TaxID=549 RepID=UPI0010C11D76|nr:fimbria/pilus outer membrane usher protein [Pantoea agglomerans]MBD8144723.1 fimbrial biogenesis outer membrane usher protein [Pantoea agglomerans]MBD8183338.1 fimbrial biogenesis outer membrane usher protein [Pantoea agglomerans]MBD8222424.1 fimbrial biogenesis outer membrane usher protein [Pantoea agglomerans]TKJ56451.1 fimbrial biogenesis outer membrane usher protein [Pantoea agglomerans]TKK19420.1 fimbrial biogenesis outer membrane usher protein [Pantoea agglomerans]